MKRPLARRIREELEAQLQRRISDSDADSVATLYDLSPDLVTALRPVSLDHPLEVIELLRFLLAGEPDLDHLWSYRREVLQQGGDPSSWGREPALCTPAFEESLTPTLDEETILRPLHQLEGLRWFRVPPTAEQRFGDLRGAPAVMVADTHYLWRPPPGAIPARLKEQVPSEQIDDLSMALRRWLASRIAWAIARQIQDLPAEVGPDDLCRALGIAPERLSRCGAAAIRGLAREFGELGAVSRLSDSEVQGCTPTLPGFRGPAEWYR